MIGKHTSMKPFNMKTPLRQFDGLILGPDSVQLADCTTNPNKPAKPEQIALANEIVKRCNAHDELVAALRSLLTSEESPHTETVRYLARSDARDTLAKLEGGAK